MLAKGSTGSEIDSRVKVVNDNIFVKHVGDFKEIGTTITTTKKMLEQDLYHCVSHIWLQYLSYKQSPKKDLGHAQK